MQEKLPLERNCIEFWTDNAFFQLLVDEKCIAKQATNIYDIYFNISSPRSLIVPATQSEKLFTTLDVERISSQV